MISKRPPVRFHPFGVRRLDAAFIRIGIIALALLVDGALFSRVRAAAPNPLLGGVIAALPDIPLVVRGDVQKRNGLGKIDQTYRVEMVLDWKADIPTARYTIRDAFGATLEHLAVTWEQQGEPAYQYFQGNPLRAAPLPPLEETIQNTDITWLDLSLSFLWWPGGEVRGKASIRGRDCRIVDVPAPRELVKNFDGVRLWVDEKIGIVMRADGFVEAGDLRRRMDIKSFKKIRNRWVIKDIDFISFPGKTKTTLLVRDVQESERFQLPDRDNRGWLLPESENVGETYGEPIDTLPVMESLDP
jgi:hypothetical protein